MMMSKQTRHDFIESIFKIVEEDNEKLLTKLRQRIDRVGIELPRVEVKFENLTIEADCYVGKRSLPTLFNTSRNIAESIPQLLGLRVSKRTSLTILKDASGEIKPSRMTLLLGPPSSGKTTLLLALAGRLDSNLKVKGKVRYNGYELNDFVPQKTSSYVSQNDIHTPEMTVRETLDFSAKCQGIGSRKDIVTKLERMEKDVGIVPDEDIDIFMKGVAIEGYESNLQCDYILKILGLDICKDTIVGDGMQRGISGGQKKRVTTGEILVGPSRTLFMDEISTGLDSSTTYQIVKCLQQTAHLAEATILMCLLQPDPETFDLFDDIILLSDGQVIYHGPRDRILEFFEMCGFCCPEKKGTAEFLQEVTSRKEQEQYWADRSKPYRYISATEFANKFKEFHVGLNPSVDPLVSGNTNYSDKEALVFTKNTVPTIQLLKANLAKEWLLLKRDSLTYISRIAQTIFMATVSATLFLRTTMHTNNEDDGSVYVGALLFAMNNNMFTGFSDLPLTVVRLPVFYKQRDLLFYPVWTFTLPNFLVRVPISIIESLIWVAISYYPVGFAPQADRFFKQFLVIFLIQQMASGLFKLIASVARTMVIANTGGSLAILIMYVLGGFVLPKHLISKWWIWGYWTSPLTYSVNALTLNEMLAPRWMNKLASDNVTRLGVAVLKRAGIFPYDYWFWICAAAVLGFAIIFNVFFTIALKYLNPIGKHQVVISDEIVNEIEENQHETITNGNGLSPSLVALKKGMVLPFVPLAVSFKDINYYVDMPKELRTKGETGERLQLLREVTGAFRPGVLTALMGVSGAGKTTLLDVLAGRKTGGFVEGDIRISGFPKNQETFARISGYCEQNDIHSSQVTVHESLIYSAFLRLPKEVSRDEKMIFVEEVMELVELKNLKDAIVGEAGVTGLSTEQRKRLTIAVELVANPSIIFMDEPTSGLDARAASIVMRTVRNTVNTGRTVVCTIHQPSIEIFESFDELLLMKIGGRVIYSGPLGRDFRKIIEHFEAIPGVVKIKDRYNPATWMLETSSTSTEVRLGIDFAEYYKMSPSYERNKALVEELETPSQEAKDLYFPTKYSQSYWEQFNSCLWKQWWMYWRYPDYNCARFFFTLVSALLLGTMFWMIGTKMNNAIELTTIIGAMFTAVIFIGINNCSSIQPIIAAERPVFYRERAAGMYSALPYALAQVIIEVPYALIQTIIYTLIVYGMIGFEWKVAKFFWFFFISFFTLLYFTYYGMMTISASPNNQIAAIFASTFYGFFNVFSGFYIPRPRIPKWWIWYYWMCPVAWTVYGLIVTQYGDLEDMIQVPGMENQMIKIYVRNHFGYDYNFIGVVAGVLVGFTVFFASMFAFCLSFLNFQKK